MLENFSVLQIILINIIFLWTGFVRSGLGFGGAALGLPFMLFVYDQPIYWLPIVGAHLLFFSSLTIGTGVKHVDWRYILRSSRYILPAALVGVFGLISLPSYWLNIFIYSVTLLYGAMWLLNRDFSSHNMWVDKILLAIGGYIAGTSLTGAPLIVAVYMRNVPFEKLRNTLFVLWFILVAIKMITLASFGVELQLLNALALLPIAAVGHFLGLRVHQAILRNQLLFKRIMGGVLVMVCTLGFLNLLATGG